MFVQWRHCLEASRSSHKPIWFYSIEINFSWQRSAETLLTHPGLWYILCVLHNTYRHCTFLFCISAEFDKGWRGEIWLEVGADEHGGRADTLRLTHLARVGRRQGGSWRHISQHAHSASREWRTVYVCRARACRTNDSSQAAVTTPTFLQWCCTMHSTGAMRISQPVDSSCWAL